MPSLVDAGRAMIDCDCPHCGSRNTKALSVLHRDGTRKAVYRREGWFYYRRSFGLHSSRTRGRTQSLTAQLAAPPPTGSLTAGGVAFVLFISAGLGGAIGFWIGLALLVLFAVFGSDPKAQEQQLKKWQSTFRCGRCGTVFVAIVEGEDTGNRALTDGAEARRHIALAHSAPPQA